MRKDLTIKRKTSTEYIIEIKRNNTKTSRHVKRNIELYCLPAISCYQLTNLIRFISSRFTMDILKSFIIEVYTIFAWIESLLSIC